MRNAPQDEDEAIGVGAVVAAMSLFGYPAMAGLICCEGFDYVPGSLNTQTGGYHWVGAWSGSGQAVFNTLTQTNVTTTGGKANAGVTTTRYLGTIGVYNETIWFAGLVQSSYLFVGSTWFELCNGVTSIVAQVGQNNATGNPLGTNGVRNIHLRDPVGQDIYTSYIASASTTYLLLVRLSFSTTSNDVADLWVYGPTDVVPPSPSTLDANYVGNIAVADLSFDTIALRNQGSGNRYLDEIRLASTSQDALRGMPPLKGTIVSFW